MRSSPPPPAPRAATPAGRPASCPSPPRPWGPLLPGSCSPASAGRRPPCFPVARRHCGDGAGRYYWVTVALWLGSFGGKQAGEAVRDASAAAAGPARAPPAPASRAGPGLRRGLGAPPTLRPAGARADPAGTRARPRGLGHLGTLRAADVGMVVRRGQSSGSEPSLRPLYHSPESGLFLGGEPSAKNKVLSSHWRAAVVLLVRSRGC